MDTRIYLKSLGMNLFEFDDIGLFLRAYAENCKQIDKKYSYRGLSKELGMRPNFYSRLTNKDKPAPVFKAIDKLAKLMGLSEDEIEYMELLEKIRIYWNMVDMREFSMKRRDQMKSERDVFILLNEEWIPILL